MREFNQFIRSALAMKQFLGISSAKDLCLFTKGCLAAKYVYKQVDDELEKFKFFDKYVNAYFGSPKFRDWGIVIDYFAESEEHSLKIFAELFDSFNFIDYSDVEHEANPINGVLKKVENCNSFVDFFHLLEINYSLLGIKSIEDFDLVYLGYFTYGDFDKGKAIFGELHDKSCINLHHTENPFKKFISKQFSIFPVYDYASMIKYISPNGRDMEYLFSLFKNFLLFK